LKTTPNYNFKKMELTDSPPDIEVINPNWDTIDIELKKASESASGSDKKIGDTTTLRTTDKTSLVAAVNEINKNIDDHLADGEKHVTPTERTNWNAKLNESDLKSATTGQKGIVQLNNTVTSTSTTQAATANAVKTAYDKAVSAANTAGGAAKIADGSFAGDGVYPRFINVGFTPKLVIFYSTNYSNFAVVASSRAYHNNGSNDGDVMNPPSGGIQITTNGFNLTKYSNMYWYNNESNKTQNWVAFG
jgi:phage-related tail fiber protein